MICKNCGSILADDIRFCGNCGTKLEALPPPDRVSLNPYSVSEVHKKTKSRSSRSIKLFTMIAIISLLVIASSFFAIQHFNSVNYRLNSGHKFISSGNYDKAILAFERVIKIDPSNIDARMGLAEVYVEMGRPDQAIDWLEEVIDLDETNVDAYIKLAEIWLENDNKKEALYILEKGLELAESRKLERIWNDLNSVLINSKHKSVVIHQNKVEIHEQLTAFAAKYEEETGVKVTVKTSGGDSPYAENLRAEFQSDRQPDIYVIEGMGGYNTWSSKLTPFEDDEWIDLTALEFVVDGKVYGFPVAVEAWGMAYNAEMLRAAGVDPASLTSQAAYKTAFEKIDAMKDELGISSVVAMAAGPDMRWVTGLHNFNGYLSAGLPYGDTSVLDKLNNGEPDRARLEEYADWVELLFDYGDRTVLLTGNYDAQVGQFATEKAAFIHQGNWIDPWLLDNGVDFEMGYAPHASVHGEHNAIFIGAPSYYVLNSDGENKDAARAFLNFMATNTLGHEYMVNEAQMVPAFTNVTLKPNAPLSANVTEWLAKPDGAYTWLQNDMPDGFGMGTIAPIYESYAKGDIDKETFIDQLAKKIIELK